MTTVFLLSLAGCASVPPRPVNEAPVVATPEELRPFAGLWRGLVDARNGRLGGPVEFCVDSASIYFHSDLKTPRRILWVRAHDGKLTGATDVWYDAARKVDVYTTFEATITAGVLHGVVSEKVGTNWADVATFTAERVTN